MTAQEIKKIYNNLKKDFEPWLRIYTEFVNYIDPTKGRVDDKTPDQKLVNGKEIIDAEGARAVRIFASGMMSGLTSPSREWFKLRVPEYDEDKEVNKWLKRVENEMYRIFETSNIYGMLNNIYEEIAIFGTAASILLEDPEKIIRGRNFTAGEYFLGADYKGKINTFGREFLVTVEQLVEEFGIENVSEKVKQKYQQKQLNDLVKVKMLILKNDNKENEFNYVAYYWEESSEKEFLGKNYFSSFPILAPRWEITTTLDVYGKSPSWFAIGDIKMLQKLQKDKILAVEKLVNPPVVIDGTSQVTSLNLMPSGITRISSFNPDASIRPVYQIAPDLNALEMLIQQTKQNIRNFYFVDLFLAITFINKSNVTATEIAQRHEEKLLMLGPVFDRLKNELLDPLISRTFELMYKNGRIPPFPYDIDVANIKVEYVSLLAQAQKMIGLSSLERSVTFILSLASAVPQVIDVVDFDKVVELHANMTGVDPRIFRKDEEVAEIRKQRAEATQQQIQSQQLLEMSKAAKNLANAEMTGNNLISQMTEIL